MSVFYPQTVSLPWDEDLVSWADEYNDKGGETDYYFPENVVVDITTYEEPNSCGEECGGDCKRCASNTGMFYQYAEVYNIETCEIITYERWQEDKYGALWSNWYYSGKRLSEVVFDTNWARFCIRERKGIFYETHIGYGKGCVWTEEEIVGYLEEESIESIKKFYIDFYGVKKD